MPLARSTAVAERAAFERFFEANVDTAWRMLACFGVPASDIEDVCQEVFIVVHRKLASFEGRSAESTWLHAICWRVWSDYRSRAHRRRELAVEVPESVAQNSPPDEAVHSARELRELTRLVEGLDDDKRAVFVLYELEGVQMKDIATIVGCPVQTGFTRLRAARKAIRAAWDERSHVR